MELKVIETGGKQYKVQVGDKIKIEKLNANEGDIVKFDKVLLKATDNEVLIGTPYLSKETVEGKILKQSKDKKKIVFKYHSKTRYRKKKGHSQLYSLVEITKI
jgi:large subunit ribosomal protein L21